MVQAALEAIGFGASGCVALFGIDGACAATTLAMRRQCGDDGS